MIQFECVVLKMPKKLHELLLHLNADPVQKKDYFDAKFVLIIVSSLIKTEELRSDTVIQRDDHRLNFARGNFLKFKLK